MWHRVNEQIEKRKLAVIFKEFRGKKVIIDSDLAALYEVETSQLKRAVRRRLDRFPEDFLFELTKDELEILRC